MVKWVAMQLLRDGRVRRGFLGIAGANVPLARRMARHFSLDNTHAVRVESVERDGPAARAGVKAGDRIVSFAGAAVNGIDDLHRVLTAERIGQAHRAGNDAFRVEPKIEHGNLLHGTPTLLKLKINFTLIAGPCLSSEGRPCPTPRQPVSTKVAPTRATPCDRVSEARSAVSRPLTSCPAFPVRYNRTIAVTTDSQSLQDKV